MQTYKILFDRNNVETGVFAISLVNNPATQDLFIAMGNEDVKEIEIKLATVSEEKRIVVGAVLIPNQKILRKDPNGGEPFNIMFEADTIKEIHEVYMSNGFQNNSTIEHNGKLVEDVTFTEVWIKEDEVHDKSLIYGLDNPIGTMFAMQKINNDEVWNDYVKTGKVKGFSIEGKFGLEKINLKREYMDGNEKSFGEKIAEAITKGFASLKLSNEPPAAEPVPVQLAQMKLSDGVTVLEAESFEAGKEVMIVNDDGTKAPAPVGEHTLEDGSVLVITQEGVIDSIKAVEVKDEMPVDMNAFYLEMADATGALSPEVLSKAVKMLFEDRFSWEISQKKREAAMSELLPSMAVSMSTEVAKQIETVKVELKKEIAEAKEIQVKLSASTKPKPETQVPDRPQSNYEKFRTHIKKFN